MPKYDQDYILRRRDWWISVGKHVQAANYKTAVKKAREGVALFPGDVVVEFRLYAVLCDCYLTNKSTNKVALKKAISKMKPLLKKMRGLPVWSVNYMKNEYYYQSRQFKKQYELGINEYRKTKDKYEMYSAGVGAANYALELAKKGQRKRAHAWAQKSVKAWGVYREVDKKYYNQYVHLALAYGILGEDKKMERSLRTSAKLCGKGAKYKEFEEVRGEVRSLAI
jgi:hypothetical protein